MRRTKIIATLGPATETVEAQKALFEAGVNIFRLNFSHQSHEWHGKMIAQIRQLSKKLNIPVGILLDTKGPEIRTGDLAHPIEIKEGQEIILSIDPCHYEKDGKIGVNYDEFIHDVVEGEKILIDNGIFNFEVVEKRKRDVVCRSLDSGVLGSRRHINLPGREVSLDSITEKDWEDMAFGVKQGVDFFAVSFIRSAQEVIDIRAMLEKHKASIKIIPKIESAEALKNLEEILEASDGVMVARGDLGAEIPFTQVPKVQRTIVQMAGRFQKPVIVATQMLESMSHHPIPTRAEVTDVSEAAWQRADSVMLSGETAAGDYPAKAVRSMGEIVMTTEQEFLETRKHRNLEVDSDRSEFGEAAAKMAQDLRDIEACVVITRTGFMGQIASSFRPRVPIFAFTGESQVQRQLQLSWGVKAFLSAFSEDNPQETIENAAQTFLKAHPEWKGKKYILLADFLVDGQPAPTLQIRVF